MNSPTYQDMLQDPGWRAVLHVLTGAFPDDRRIWRHVNLDDQTINFDGMLKESSLTGSQQALVRSTAALFNQTYTISLWEAAHRLSEGYWQLLMEGADLLRGSKVGSR